MTALIIGGVEDHAHALLSIPSTLSVAKSIQLLKGNSSKWIHDTFQEHRDFERQEGYGAFSIGVSGIEDTTKYIQNQAEHHRKFTFKEELEISLRSTGWSTCSKIWTEFFRPCGASEDLMTFFPSDESLGYFRSSLRD